ncbi:hypothetical protein M3Y94_00996100 [Aphelenchoides besseyi]|nr:hypothetical protein M3Y94_00996100 [Aphelenchoides besseyi]KAI6221205.1 ZP domain-containing protein [Aphelenchoides besseyi]
MRCFLLLQILVLTAYSFPDFTPKVEWTCSDTSVSVRVVNNAPFFGVIHPTGIRSPDCTANGTGGTNLNFNLDFDRCNVHFDRRSKKRSLRLEVHEHAILILDQDQYVNIECQISTLIATTFTPLTSDEDTLENDVAAENNTDSGEWLPTHRSVTKPVAFDVELIPAGQDCAVQIVSYGDAYDLRILLREPTQRRFRVHSCVIRSETASVPLIGSNGCSQDKNLIGDFLYEKDSAKARIPTMFRFPDSNSIHFDCSLSLCPSNEECKPNCGVKLDDPLAEDPELVSKLLRSSLPDAEDLSASGNAPSIGARRSATTSSTLVHVIDHHEKPTETANPSIRPTETTNGDHVPISITGCRCDVPSDLVLLYKLCIGLSLLFAVGCLLNIFFCCLNARGRNSTKKRRSVPKTLAPSVLTRNSYWINDPLGGNRSGTAFEEFPSQYTEAQLQPTLDITQSMNKHNSVTSYASLRPKTGPPLSTLTSSTPFYDTGPALNMSSYANRSSPPRSSGYEAPSNRTFHSNTNSVGTSPRDSMENQGTLNIPASLIASTSSTPGAVAPPFPSNKETFSVF